MAKLLYGVLNEERCSLFRLIDTKEFHQSCSPTGAVVFPNGYEKCGSPQEITFWWAT